ncbi:12975_t:CDS:2 [Acaulospora colombiana]|uniref:12975_t:CDS:1 n=1 Tax=Acaulospora colombiana TaxID=27376 RepID=A0ACA9KH60_9GLOM|nr:12975_t:CDS:2 [Acaulospora colombiana]
MPGKYNEAKQVPETYHNNFSRIATDSRAKSINETTLSRILIGEDLTSKAKLRTGRHGATASPKYPKTKREVLTARDWPTCETSAKSINQLSPPETGRREQLLATTMASPKCPKIKGLADMRNFSIVTLPKNTNIQTTRQIVFNLHYGSCDIESRLNKLD